MEPKQSDFQDLVQTHVLNLHTEQQEPADTNSDNNELDDVEIIDQLDSEDEQSFEEEAGLNDDSETSVVDASSLNPDCLLLCGRILRIMGDEVMCKACGKHLRSMGDEIFTAYAFKKTINALLQDMSYRENQSPVC